LNIEVACYRGPEGIITNKLVLFFLTWGNFFTSMLKEDIGVAYCIAAQNP
jgi:hypothetical protein